MEKDLLIVGQHIYLDIGFAFDYARFSLNEEVIKK